MAAEAAAATALYDSRGLSSERFKDFLGRTEVSYMLSLVFPKSHSSSDSAISSPCLSPSRSFILLQPFEVVRLAVDIVLRRVRWEVIEFRELRRIFPTFNPFILLPPLPVPFPFLPFSRLSIKT